ncbi:MAG: thioether cross-link-forming SCIFF peptide maturase, partial [Eubacterium aggregans]
MIHKFYLNGWYIVLDVNSGTLLTVDEMTYDVLDRYRKENKETIIQGLKEKYPEDALAEVLDELDALVAQKMLYTENDYDPEIYKNHDLIKALCL